MKRLLLLLLVLMTAIALFFAFRNQAHIKKQLVTYLTERIEKETGWKVELKGVQFAFPLHIEIAHLRLFEQDTPLLLVKELQVTLSPIELLRKNLVFHSIQIKTASVFHAVLQKKNGKQEQKVLQVQQEEPPTSFSWNGIPSYLTISTIEIQELFIDPKILNALNLTPYTYKANQESLLHLQGKLHLDANKKNASAEFIFYQLSHPTEQIDIALGVVQEGEQLRLRTRLTATENGILTKLLKLPNYYAFQCIAQASATKDTWKQIANGAGKGKQVDDKKIEGPENSVTGDFQFSYSAKSDSPDAASLLGSYGALKGAFALSTTRALLLNDIEGIAGPILLQGNLDLSPTLQLRNDSTLHFQTSDISALEEILQSKAKGQAKLECKLSGNILSPHFALHLESNSLEFDGYAVEQVECHANGHYGEKEVEGLLSLSANKELRMLYASSDFVWDKKETLMLPHLQLKGMGTHVKGALSLFLANANTNAIISGDLEGNADLAQFDGVLPKSAIGEVLFTAHFYPQPQQTAKPKQGQSSIQAVDVVLQAATVKTDSFVAEQSIAMATLLTPFQEATGNLKFSMQTMRANANANAEQWTLHNLQGESEVSRESMQWPFSLSCKAEQRGEKKVRSAEVASQGFWYCTPDAFQLTIRALDGKIENDPFTLQEPVTLQIAPDLLTLSPLFFTSKEGSLRTTFHYDQKQLNATIQMQEIPLRLFGVVETSVPVTGLLSAAIALSGSPADITGEMQIEVKEVKIVDDAFAMLPPLHASFFAFLRDERLRCEGKIIGAGQQPIEFSANLPVSVSLMPPSIQLHDTQKLSAHMAASGQIGSLIELFATTTTMAITGQTTIALDLQGSIADPKVTGLIEIANGSFENHELGTSLQKMHAKIQLAGKQILLTELHAVDAKSGSFSGTGAAELDMSKDFPFEFAFQLEKAALIRVDYAQADVSGNVFIKGNSKGAMVTGKLATNSAKVELPEQIGALSDVIEVTYINQPLDEAPPTKPKSKPVAWPIAFDLQLDVPNKASIKGRGFNSEWKGSVTMKGDGVSPLFYGDFSIIKGTYLFNGKDFQVNQGTITLAGDLEKKTTLYVIAHKQIENIKVEVILKGSITTPAIAFRSNPPLSQREIVSWILFNRGLSEITPFQGTQLNDSITDLGETNDKPDMLTQIRNKIGIDRIDINRDGSGESNEVSLQVGKYISQGIFISVNKSITAETNRIAIEANVFHNLKVQAEVGDNQDGQLSLKWRHDY